METAPTTSTPTHAPGESTPHAPVGVTLSACPVATPSRSLRTLRGRPVNLRKPSYALVYAGTSMGGGHDLELRGVPVKIAADMVTIKVDMVKGGETGILYTDRFPFLIGQRVTVARENAVLFM